MTTPAIPFSTIGIIGFGLIGSSIARAVRRQSPHAQIICMDQSIDVCKTVLDLSLADYAAHHPDILAQCDVVILCTPVGAMGAVMRDIAPSLKQGVVITDVGSVKQAVIDAVAPHIPAHASFVPAHPMSGTEQSGPFAGSADLFDGKLWLITPMDETPLKSLQSVQEFYESLGAITKIMTADIHDQTLAMTSHLPQLISYMIIHTADQLGKDLNHDVLSISANGFYGFARIAASDPIMWRDIYLNNKTSVLGAIDRFDAVLATMRQAIEQEDSTTMVDFFSASRTRHLKHLETKKRTHT